MGRRDNSDGQSMASASSSRRSAPAAGSVPVDPSQLMPAPVGMVATPSSSSAASAAGPGAARKSGRLFSLRRMIQDVQHQRRGSSSRRQRRSMPVDVPQSAPHSTAAAAETPAPPRPASDSGWCTPRATSSEALNNAGDTASTAPGDDLSEAGIEAALQDCSLCALAQPRSCFARVTSVCGHCACVDCLRRYLTIEIMESRINVECPACPERLHPNDIRRLLGPESADLVSKYEEFALRRLLAHDPDARWCPAPDCGYVVIATGCASCPKLTCKRPGCGTLFCYHCKQTWHSNQTCDAARAERLANARASFSCSQDSSSHNEIKLCPRCSAFIIKMDDGSCNHMTCAVCGAEFCWLCMKEISDLHYLSPSGCTFWGKKPWSRKKKVIWQLGTLVGAPVGISLIAAIAVPAIIIGVPIWVGRKLYTRCASMTKHKRNLAVASGVISSILLSPILAALAVGIGVPLLLAYVYGVVPISLCRSGGCGVSTTDNGGVRIDFDESDVPAETVVSPFAAAGDTRSVVDADGHRAINPSIGPSIGEMSVGMTNSLSASGSHLERVGVIREDCCSDRDSASHQAMAGSCINASLSGSLLAGPTGFHNRLEVQAEVTNNSTAQQQQQQKRASLSSESANFSIDAKSVTVSFGDNVSVVALAGSICARDKDNNSAVVSLNEMHSDNAPAAQHMSVAGSPPPVNGACCDDAVPHRVPLHRCSSPPTGRSVSFLCEQQRGNTETPARPSVRCASVGACEHKETSLTAVPSSSVSGSASTQRYVEDERSLKLDMTAQAVCPSGIHVCNCLNAPSSRLSEADGGRPASHGAHTLRDHQVTSEVVEMSPMDVSTQGAAAECCVIHLSTLSSD